MSEVIVAFSGIHGFVQFCIVLLIGCMFRLTMRAIMVACRGWPPEHLDADGDWKTVPKP